MRYISDLHVHSHYSRATSKDLNLESLYQWAKIKGINVVGTGDFTHPEWFAELKEKLQPDGNGFFTLKDPPADQYIPGIRTKDIDVRFCLTSEISSIYKHGDRVRKNHNLVYAPDLDTVACINHKLSSIGNLEADGRPILGLPARDLLEIVLETSDRAHLVPAHIWTPWFSTLGSKAGYDSIDACFRDLADQLFAVETGLSSDPRMNWKLSALDRFTLISNSDAHSPSKLGREANLLDTELSYDAMFKAFKTGKGVRGTYEFYPQEGKYHHDGHRKCDISFEPRQSLEHDNICPECGKPLTVGVLHRVEALADRDESRQPENSADYQYIIPLPEVLGEIEDVGPKTKTVRKKYRRIISNFGNEFFLLHQVPIEDIRKSNGDVLAEAISRIRNNEVHPKAGYDGVFGVINVFQSGEIDRIRGQLGFFNQPEESNEQSETTTEPEATFQEEEETDTTPDAINLNAEQQSVVESTRGATLVKAGPGTGKTHTLIEWLARQVESSPSDASNIVAVTFTRKAAEEIQERLQQRVGSRAQDLTIGTFHALCWQWLQEQFDHLSTVYDAASRRMALRILFPGMSTSNRKELHEQIGSYNPDSSFAKQIQTYRKHLWEQGAVDLSDLIHRTVEELQSDEEWRIELRKRCKVLTVDELQDINQIQYELVNILGHDQNMLAIGDADQAIYGFRGAEVSLFFRFADDFEAQEIALKQNYRSTGRILEAASSLIQHNRQYSGAKLVAQRQSDSLINVYEAANPLGEADYILEEINRYVGGIESLTTGTHTDSEHRYGFGDIAILFRTNAVGEALFKSLTQAGIPVHFGDGTPFLNEPPFTIVAHLLRFLQQPEDHVILSNLLEEGYSWSPDQINSLLQSLQENKMPLLGDEPLKGIGQSLQQDLDHLRECYRSTLDLTETGNLREAVSAILDTFMEEEQLSDSQLLKKQTLLELAEESEGDAEQFLNQMQLNPYTDAGRLQWQSVHLLTFHAAKGLEFPVVFIAAAEEGIAPILREGADIDEERRLFYVAMTRAEDELQITHCRKRFRYGTKEQLAPSRFIGELPQQLIEKESEASSSEGNQSDTDNDQLGLF
jgi:uncharacterized protein (TIGR00375 family)